VRLLLTAAIALLLARPPHVLVRLAARLLPGVLFFVPTERQAIALTVDDGPHPATTPALLDVLARHEARATFFVLGASAERYPGLMARIAAEGHELGNHTYFDEPSALLPPAVLEQRIAGAHDVLVRFGPVRLLRPGSGWITPRVLRAAERHGYRCVLGSVYPHDAHVRWPRYLVWDVLRRVRPGTIVILHEGSPGRAQVARVVDTVLPVLRSRGYEVLTVSELRQSI
jgi:peptidoglycan-N-acetylglucosamine deacetylase